MFLKPFRVKSNSQIKGSDRKKLRARLAAAFPSLTAECCAALIPTKEEVSVSRLLTHAGEAVTCYICGREPLFLEMNDQLLPTVYALWRHPDMVPVLTTHAPVVRKLQGGADLMLPGVICDTTAGVRAFPKLKKNDAVAINTDANLAPSGIGVAARSSDDLYMMAGRGKAVLLVHVIGDQIWEMGSRKPAPDLGPPPLIAKAGLVEGEDGEDDDSDDDDGGADAGTDGDAVGDEAPGDEPVAQVDTIASGVEALDLGGPEMSEDATEPDPPEPVSMDQLLYDAFRQAWRTSARRLELPVLVSNFYAQHMQPNSAQPLDVKKSSHKKMSKFLDKMQTDGLVQVQELKPGVQSIVSVNLEHREIRGYRVQAVVKEDTSAQGDGEPEKHDKGHGRSRTIEKIEELYIVSGNVVKIFKGLSVNKGTPMPAQQVRKYLTEYVKKNDLQDPAEKSQVRLDGVLADCLTQRSEGSVSTLRWDELHQRCLQRMSPGHVVAFVGEPPQLKKGNVPCVELNTATRSGNKKITLVLNLPVFGIDPAEFAHRCQVGVAASTSVGEAPNRPPGTSQVMVQGNQIRFIGRLLQEDFKVPKKYIKGLEKAPKK